MPLDFAAARENMVENDVRTSDVTDRRLIAAMRAIAREAFVPPDQREIAYGDLSVPIGSGRFLLDPRTFSKLVQAADLEGREAVLDIGSATGYSALVLARLAHKVVALEADEALASAAEVHVAAAGVRNVTIQRGSLNAGAPGQGPFDVIILQGMAEELPQSFAGQLKPEGRLLAVIAGSGRMGRAMSFTKAGGGLSGRGLFDATIPLLPGFAKERAFTF